MSKYTPWFPPEVKPVHVGVYEVRNNYGTKFIAGRYAYWSGSAWGTAEPTEFEAQEMGQFNWASQNKRWRGLTKPAKA